MNQLSAFRIARLASSFEAGLSLRKAAVECGVNRNTVLDYYKKFRAGWRVDKAHSKPRAGIAGEVSGFTYLALETEAIERTMTMKELVGLIVENVARDQLFAAVLDD